MDLCNLLGTMKLDSSYNKGVGRFSSYPLECELILFCYWRKKTTKDIAQVVSPSPDIQDDIMSEDPSYQVHIASILCYLCIFISSKVGRGLGKLQFKLKHKPHKFLRLRVPASDPGSNPGLPDHRWRIPRINLYPSRDPRFVSRRTSRMRSRPQRPCLLLGDEGMEG